MDEKTLQRFWDKVCPEPNGGCWLWLAHVDRFGYGRINTPRGPQSAHRLAYEHFKGPIPGGLEVDHLCRVRGCVNPDHLEAVTHRDNLLRGASPSAVNARKTHCKRGHPFSKANTSIVQDGRRCLKCHRARQAAYLARKRRQQAASS